MSVLEHPSGVVLCTTERLDLPRRECIVVGVLRRSKSSAKVDAAFLRLWYAFARLNNIDVTAGWSWSKSIDEIRILRGKRSRDSSASGLVAVFVKYQLCLVIFREFRDFGGLEADRADGSVGGTAVEVVTVGSPRCESALLPSSAQ